jgi:hypothetical protein
MYSSFVIPPFSFNSRKQASLKERRAADLAHAGARSTTLVLVVFVVFVVGKRTVR